jgi:MinD superfamily P-loop ATPase
MKQLVILSGKGGTGKTSVTAAFAHLACESGARIVLADGDVDAANLELLLRPRRLEEHAFMGGTVAVIDEELCPGCGICEQVCRFEAICGAGGGTYHVDPVACEGCAACYYQCPEKAIHMEPQLAGHWFRSESRYGALFHAELLPAQENSGRLVTIVKQQARLLGVDTGADTVIVDGPPGIGCPVISAVAGADLALIVAEPTAAGIHDMERVVQMTRHFGVRTEICINKDDINPRGAERIREFCEKNDLELVGRIAFDEMVTRAMMLGEPITAFDPDIGASRSLARIWERVWHHLNGKDGSHDGRG